MVYTTPKSIYYSNYQQHLSDIAYPFAFCLLPFAIAKAHFKCVLA